MMYGGYFPFISISFPPSGCFLPTVVAPRVWTGQRRPRSPWLVTLLKDERGVETTRKVITSTKMKFQGSSMGFNMSVCPIGWRCYFLISWGFQDNGSVLCVFSFYHVLPRKCSWDARLKNIKSNSRGHSTPPTMRSQFGL